MTKIKSTLQNLFQWLLFSVMVFYIHPRFGWFALVAGTLVFCFTERHKLKLLSAMTFLGWIFGNYIRWPQMKATMLNLGINLNFKNYPFKFSVSLLALVLGSIFIKICIRSKIFYKHPVYSFSVFYLLLLSVGNLAQGFLLSKYSLALLWGAIFIFAQMTWGLILLVEQMGVLGNGWGLALMRIQPFWGNGEIAQVPLGEVMYQESEQTNPKDMRNLKWSALKLLFYLCLARGFYQISQILVLGQLQTLKVPQFLIPYENYFGTFEIMKAIENFKPLPDPNIRDLIVRWTLLIFEHFIYILDRFFIGFSVPVAAARFVGFNVPRAVHKPYLARTFYDFWTRTMAYYAWIVIRFGIEPALDFFRFIKNSSLRIAISAIAGIVFVGLVTHHYFYYVYQVPSRGLADVLIEYTNVLPYLFSVGLVMALSMTLERRVLGRRFFSIKSQIIRMIVYVLIWALLQVIFRYFYLKFTIEDLRVWLRAMGLT